MERATEETKRSDVLKRISGISLIVGAVVVTAGNAIHPRVSDPADYRAVLQMITDTRGGYWEAVHLFLAAGFWALAAGLAGLYRSIDTGAGAAWARLGFYGVLVGTAFLTFEIAMEGIGRAIALGALETAVAADKPAIEGFLIGLTLISYPIFGVGVIIYWLSLAVVGMGIVTSGLYPQWSGWAFIVLGVATAGAAGLPYAFVGANMTVDLIFAVLATLSALVALVLGILLMRLARLSPRG